jgi:hypothetical protein
MRRNLDPACSRIGKSGPGCSLNGRESGEFLPQILFVVGLMAAGFRAEHLKVLLQPQMEKYRCLWCKSSSNHNI